MKAGEIFEGDELIIERSERSMRTIRCERGIEAGEEYDIRTFMYSLSYGKVRYNGYGGISRTDKRYFEYKRRLEQAGLWKLEEELA